MAIAPAPKPDPVFAFDIGDPSEEATRRIALIAAVLHHGLSNLSHNSVPCRVETLTTTADAFVEWLDPLV